jgi:uncharacterized delta-60 repeat protein
MANPGSLDTTFGSGGKKTVNFGGVDVARAVLVQPNGRVVVAGGGGPASSFCVVRLRAANGTLDPTFGSGGKRTIDFGGDDEGDYGAALQPNGKIVLAGFSGPEGGNVQLARLNANGKLDTTFGTGGIAGVDFGGDDFGEAVARQADGRILVAGRSTAAGAVVARLRATGVLDPAFGGDGRVTLPGGGSASAVLVQPDRKIVVAGNASGSQAMTVTRLKPDGTPDATFGTAGTATIDFGSLADLAAGAALQADGRIVVAGYTQSAEDVAVARLNANGSPDPTFGAAGKATVDFGAATFGNAVALAPRKRILVAGQKTGNDDFAVARLLG